MQRAIIYITILAISLTACVKDHLHKTSHPDYGVVAVAIDVPDGAGDSGYTVEIDGAAIDSDGGQEAVSQPLTPGGHDVVVYNTPEGITVTDGIAYVDTEDDGTIIPDPGHLYSGTEEVIFVEDDTTRVDLDIAQRTRDLRIELTVIEGDPDRIATITGTLSGVAGAYDIRNNTLCGDPVSVSPTFTRDGDLVTADLCLLGFIGDAQTLTLYITFTDRDDVLIVESDVTELLATFNGGTDTFILKGNLCTPIEAGVGDAEINGWTTIIGDHVTAE